MSYVDKYYSRKMKMLFEFEILRKEIFVDKHFTIDSSYTEMKRELHRLNHKYNKNIYNEIMTNLSNMSLENMIDIESANDDPNLLNLQHYGTFYGLLNNFKTKNDKYVYFCKKMISDKNMNQIQKINIVKKIIICVHIMANISLSMISFIDMNADTKIYGKIGKQWKKYKNITIDDPDVKEFMKIIEMIDLSNDDLFNFMQSYDKVDEDNNGNSKFMKVSYYLIKSTCDKTIPVDKLRIIINKLFAVLFDHPEYVYEKMQNLAKLN